MGTTEYIWEGFLLLLNYLLVLMGGPAFYRFFGGLIIYIQNMDYITQDDFDGTSGLIKKSEESEQQS
jgi:hypothetical protein